VDSEILIQALDYIERENLAVHSLLVVREGSLVMEAYFPPYSHRVRQNTFSCTKSFTSALIGIALREGYIESVDQRALDFLPDVALPEDDPRYAITIEDLLRMRCGLYWPESSVSYSSGENILMQMLRSPDWIQFILDQPMETTPGSVFNYNSGCSHLLAVILREATGMSPLSFARQYLFEPLGITAVSWMPDRTGANFGGGGLWLRPRDMAKFGQLYLQGGVWNDQQIIPADWVEASVSDSTYGYQWWMLAGGAYAALGYRGQRIVVFPDREMVVVITADQPSATSQYVIDTFIVPAAYSSEPLPPNPEAAALLSERISEMMQP
jgi:CubicO group peptidase (beta-lactamase class C family)